MGKNTSFIHVLIRCVWVLLRVSPLVLQLENPFLYPVCFFGRRGWSGGAMALGNHLVPGRPTLWIRVGQGPTVLDAGRGCLDSCTLIYPFSLLSPSLWETARYRMKYCFKGPLNPKQPTNQPSLDVTTLLKGIFSIWEKLLLVLQFSFFKN